MNRISKILLIGLLLLIPISFFAQPMMRTLDDAFQLKKNEQQFIGKSLENLLKEIRPTIKMALVTSNRPHGGASYIRFYFYDFNDRKSFNARAKTPLNIIVFIKENSIEWDKYESAEGKSRLKWTKEDAEKLGHLTVTGIKISGEVLK